MNCKKQNISLPADLFDYLSLRVKKINQQGRNDGAKTSMSAQVALAVRTLKTREESPECSQGAKKHGRM
jgi:hypothetical protein